jgi:hypothetical protein
MIKISSMKHRHGVPVRRLSQSQQGMASIVITMVTMVVISLIVLGFATISRREARQSLDQLQSTQAFYAAESGVEDAREIIKNLVAAGQPVPAKSSCTTNDAGVTEYPTGAAMTIDTGIEYTCLQVNPAPDDVEFDGIDADSTVIPITASDDIRELEFSWQPQSPTGTPASCPGDIDHEFRPQSGAGAWMCGYGVLRVDVVPTSGLLTRAGLLSSMYGGFFQPVNFATAGTDRYDINTGQAKLVAANCTIASYGTCRVNVTNIPNGIRSMMVRISSIYQPSDVKVSALNASGSPLEISGVQAEIDVTGKATDVLRRIKVRVPLVNTSSLLPGSAITSNGSICKRFSTTDAYLNIPSFLDPDASNDMCQPLTDGTL